MPSVTGAGSGPRGRAPAAIGGTCAQSSLAALDSAGHCRASFALCFFASDGASFWVVPFHKLHIVGLYPSCSLFREREKGRTKGNKPLADTQVRSLPSFGCWEDCDYSTSRWVRGCGGDGEGSQMVTPGLTAQERPHSPTPPCSQRCQVLDFSSSSPALAFLFLFVRFLIAALLCVQWCGETE